MQHFGPFLPPRRTAFGVACIALSVALIGTAIAAPIRVGVFKGVGKNRFWHTNIHTAGAQISILLANPDSANIGPNLIKAPGGFAVSFYGVSGSVSGTPTATQVEEFIAALDTLDVVFITSFTDVPSILDSNQRVRFESFVRTKGFVSIHGTTDSYGSWAGWDSIHGTRFQNHPSSDRTATVHLDTVAIPDPALRFLNRGLPDTASFLEEWFSHTTDGAVIRAKTGLKVSVRIDEASYTGGMGGARAMGEDHPMSWYRTFPEGGRFFYTAIGHRAQNYAGTPNNSANPATNFLRRQLYNAILWTAGVDSTGAISIRGDQVDPHSPSRFADRARLSLSGGTLTVTMLRDGAHTVEIRALDGRRIAMRSNAQRGGLTFQNLSPGVHLITVRTTDGTATRLVNIP